MKKARTQIFYPVLVLLPIHGSILQIRYCGPYIVERKTSDVDCVIVTLEVEMAMPCEHIEAWDNSTHWLLVNSEDLERSVKLQNSLI